MPVYKDQLTNGCWKGWGEPMYTSENVKAIWFS